MKTEDCALVNQKMNDGLQPDEVIPFGVTAEEMALYQIKDIRLRHGQLRRTLPAATCSIRCPRRPHPIAGARCPRGPARLVVRRRTTAESCHPPLSGTVRITMDDENGTQVTLRPIRPEDEPLLADFHETLSDRSVYSRCSIH
jgi:hypothetical protein